MRWSRGADDSRTIRVPLHLALGLAVMPIGRAMAQTVTEPDRTLRLVVYGFGAEMLCPGPFSTGVLYAGGVSVVVCAFVGGSLALLGAVFVVLGRYA